MMMSRPDSKFVDNLPSKSRIFDHWKDRLPALGILIDWGEPGCWACRFHYGTKYDVKRPNASWSEILRGWDRIPLQRCHVVPRSLGGTDDVDNLFLMCRECHDLAPNTSIPAIFFEWAGTQSSCGREMAKIRAALDAFRVSEQEAQDLEVLLESEERHVEVQQDRATSSSIELCVNNLSTDARDLHWACRLLSTQYCSPQTRRTNVWRRYSPPPKYPGFLIVQVSPQCWPPPSTVSVSPVM